MLDLIQLLGVAIMFGLVAITPAIIGIIVGIKLMKYFIGD